MKKVINAMLCLLCISCSAQNIQYSNTHKSSMGIRIIDTLSILPLKNKQYGSRDYKVLRLCNLDRSGYWIDSSRRIELTRKNKIIASISLPVPDENIKNFSVTDIKETDSGFTIVVDWGGGINFYGRAFSFMLKDKRFYLDSLEIKRYTQDSGKEIKERKKISPPIPIEAFNILLYLENE